MTWAWAVPLPPTAKLVLMALADEADDAGYCFPSHRRIAAKASVTERTARRVIAELEVRGYLCVSPRYRPDRSRTSNGYQLASGDPPEKVSRGEGPHVRGPRTPVTRVVDTGALGTTSYPLSNPQLPSERSRPDSTSATDTPSLTSGGQDLQFPTTLSVGEVATLKQLLSGVDCEQAQQVLDELAGRMKVGRVNNPSRYCAALLARVRSQKFTPELGIRIGEERAERLRLQQRRDSAKGASADVHALVHKLPDHLRQPLERMRNRSESHANTAPSNDKSSSDSGAR